MPTATRTPPVSDETVEETEAPNIDEESVSVPTVYRYDGKLYTTDGDEYDGDTEPAFELDALPDVKPATPEPLVDLDAIEKEPAFKVGGKIYYFRQRGDIGPVDDHQLRRDGDEFREYYRKEEELVDTEQARFDELLDTLFDRIVVAPKKIRDGVPPGYKAALVVNFIWAPLLQAARAEQLMQALQAGDGSTMAS